MSEQDTLNQRPGRAARAAATTSLATLAISILPISFSIFNIKCYGLPSIEIHANAAVPAADAPHSIDRQPAMPALEPRLTRQVGDEILEPPDGAVVSPEFAVHGRLRRHELAWLFVRRGGGLLVPKEPSLEPTDSGAFDGYVHEGGPDGDLELVLAEVSRAGDAAIRSWFEDARRLGHYAGLPPTAIDGYRELDARRLRLRR